MGSPGNHRDWRNYGLCSNFDCWSPPFRCGLSSPAGVGKRFAAASRGNGSRFAGRDNRGREPCPDPVSQLGAASMPVLGHCIACGPRTVLAARETWNLWRHRLKFGRLYVILIVAVGVSYYCPKATQDSTHARRKLPLDLSGFGLSSSRCRHGCRGEATLASPRLRSSPLALSLWPPCLGCGDSERVGKLRG